MLFLTESENDFFGFKVTVVIISCVIGGFSLQENGKHNPPLQIGTRQKKVLNSGLLEFSMQQQLNGNLSCVSTEFDTNTRKSQVAKTKVHS